MRPVLTFQTGRSPAISLQDAVSSRDFNIQRTFGRSAPGATSDDRSDDFLVCNESGYDAIIKDKGISSSLPVVLGIVPIRDLGDEEEIINIQRNLNVQTLKSVSRIIDQSVSTLTTAEKRALSETPKAQLETDFNDLFAVYKPKSAYLQFIDDFLEMQIANGPKFQIDIENFPSNRSPTSFAYKPPEPYGINGYPTTRDWATNTGYVRVYPDRFNITNMMQMLKMTLSGLKYTINNVSPATNKTFSVDGAAPTTTCLEAASTLNDVYRDLSISEGDFDSIAKEMMLILAKENIYNSSFGQGSSLNIQESIASLTGELVLDIRSQDFQGNPSLGSFDQLVKFTNEGKNVLHFDNVLTSQELLSNFETADQFYLTYPIGNDRQLLPSRLNSLERIIGQLTTQITAFNDKLVSDKSENFIKQFLNTLNDFIKSSMLTDDKTALPNQNIEVKTLAVLLKAKEDKQLLDYIFKILMFRDRIRYPSSYVDEDQKDEFISKCNEKLLFYLEKLSYNYFGFRYEDSGDVTLRTDGVNMIVNLLNGASIGNIPDNRNYAYEAYGNPSAFAPYSATAIVSGFGDLYESLLDTTRGMLWDVFYTGAASAVFPLFSTRINDFDGNNPLRARANQVTQFYKFSRDQRALCYLMSTLSFLSSNVRDAKFYVNSYTQQDGDTLYFKFVFGHDVNYFRQLSEALQDITGSSFKLSTNIGTSLNLKYQTSSITPGFEDLTYYLDGVLRPVLQSIQNASESLNYINTFMSTSLRLLKDASKAAFRYNSKYGESLIALYTINTLTNLAKIKNRYFSPSRNFPKYNGFYARSSDYLNGMAQYAQKILPRSEDSFIVLCAFPYGLLERLGAYDLRRKRDVNVTLTFREVDSDSSEALTISNTYPAVSFVNPGAQTYNIESNSSRESFLEKTQLYYMTQNGSIAADTFTETSVKAKEVESTSILEYVRALYGLDLDLESLKQTNQVDATSLFPVLESAKNKIIVDIQEKRFNQLVTSRYVRSAENTIGLGQQEFFQNALSGITFDKIIAIPVEGSSLRRDKDFFLCDILITVTLAAEGEIPEIDAQEILANASSRTDRASQTINRALQDRLGRSS